MPPPVSTHSPRLGASLGLWLFLATFTVRLLVLFRFSTSPDFVPEGDDMKFYLDWAMRIAQGQWTDHQAFYGLPGYAYLLAIITLGIHSTETAGLAMVMGGLQAALDAGIAVLMFKISREAFTAPEGSLRGFQAAAAPNIIGICAALAWTLFTPSQAFSAVLMPTVWLVFAYYLCLWFAIWIGSFNCWWLWLFLGAFFVGIFCGLIAMMVATILFAVPILIAAIFRSVSRGHPWRVRLPKIAAVVTALVAGLYIGAAPAWIHNYFIAHEPVMLSAHSGINFWIGNNPTATGYPKMPPGIRATQEGLLKDSITLAEAAAGRKLTRAEVSKYWSTQANGYISTHFDAWLRLMGVKFANFWNAYQYDDLSIIKLLRDEGVLPPGLRFGFIAALGLAGLVPTLWRYPKAGWVVAAVVLHMAALMPVFVTERYRLAAVPGLMIIGAAGLWIFWENVATARWGWASGYVALCAGAAWFVSIPRTEIGLWSLDHYKAGIRATTAGELEVKRGNLPAADEAFSRAQRNLETAYRYVSNNADIDFAMGNLWLARSGEPGGDEKTQAAERTRAKLFYRLALELNPRHTGTLNNLGVLAFEEKRWPLAEKFFLAAIETEPDDAKAHFLLARTYAEDQKLEEARAELDKALAIRPKQREFLELRAKLANPAPSEPGK